MGLEKGALLGPYEIVELVGTGGMGEVYRARDQRIGRDVAVKVLPPEFATNRDRLRRFEQEARAAGRLDHPNILAVHDVGSADGLPYMVTELLKGETLRARMNAGGLSSRRAIEMAIQIARGLSAAHEKGIVHRDLKPANIFITGDGTVKVLDFGLAKVLQPEGKPDPYASTAASASSTQVGAVLGTMGYMSPEQVRGQRADARSDIFAFGCVLYEMLSGRAPFVKATGPDTVSAVLLEDPPGLDGPSPVFTPALRQIVRRCLEKRPQDRFATAHDLALALEAASSGETVGAVAFRSRPTGRRLLWVLAGVTAVAVLGLAGLWVRQAGRSDQLPAFRTRQVTGQHGIESEPAVSPSGHEIAYAVKENGRSTIWITDIRGGNPLRLTDGPNQARDPAWFPDGSTLAFTSDEGLADSIWKVPRFGGAPLLLVHNAEQAALSPDGTRIAFGRRAEEGFRRIWVAPLAAVDQARRITGPGDGVFDHSSPAWSPDGRTICYGDQQNLWLVPADGGKAHRLTSDDAADRDPAWSADGRFVYFTSMREGTQALWRVPAKGGRPGRVTDGTGSEHFPSLSRDGRRLAFVSHLRSGTIALADLRTGTVARVQEGSFACLPAIAPDRSALVFVSSLGGSVGLRSVPLRDGTPSGQSLALTDQPGDVASPAFSPDGRWVAYYRADRGQRQVWVVPARGGAPVDFSARQGQNVQPVWSPDSAQIAFVSNRGGPYQIWVAPFVNGHRGGEPRRVTAERETASYPSWSPDGKAIAYVLLTDEGKEVWLARADGSGGSRRVTTGAQAYSLRWFGTTGQILVSGYWGEPLPALRLLSPDTGDLRPFPLPGSLALDPKIPDFDVSPDGALLALFEGKTQGVIWVREAEKGSF